MKKCHDQKEIKVGIFYSSIFIELEMNTLGLVRLFDYGSVKCQRIRMQFDADCWAEIESTSLYLRKRPKHDIALAPEAIIAFQRKGGNLTFSDQTA